MSELALHPVPREQRSGTYCEDYELNGCPIDGCPQSCYHSRGVVSGRPSRKRRMA